jgi:hypothetical protein
VDQQQLKSVFKTTNLLTPKEINVMIRSLPDGKLEYIKFKDVLFDVRFELVKSRLLDTNLSEISNHVLEECKRIDKADTGKINIEDLKLVFYRSKKISLTPFQVLTNV